MGGEHERGGQLPVQVYQEAHDVVGILGVQVGGRFVGDNELRFLDDSPGDGHPLALAAAQLRRPGFHLIHEIHPFQGLIHRLLSLSGGHPCKQQRELHVLENVVHRQQVEGLENEPDPQPTEVRQLPVVLPAQGHVQHRDRALRRGIQPADNIEQGGLAGAGGPHQSGEFAHRHVHGDVSQGGKVTAAHRVALHQVAYLNNVIVIHRYCSFLSG
ncbi:hypothetical protein ES703_55357 [subsurface metagenome]